MQYHASVNTDRNWFYLSPKAQGKLCIQVSNVFAGKHGFITPRDLFKWAERGAIGYEELAQNGYLLLGERLRTPEDRAVVQRVLEKQMKVQVGCPAYADTCACQCSFAPIV